MNQTPTYLNQYTGFDAQNIATVIVAPDMATAVQVYVKQKEEDPVQMQTTKRQIYCVLPDTTTSFQAKVYDSAGGSTVAGFIAAPASGIVVGGTSQWFEARAAEGWQFVKWQIDGTDVEDSTAIMELDIPTVTDGHTVIVRAVFQAE